MIMIRISFAGYSQHVFGYFQVPEQCAIGGFVNAFEVIVNG